MGKTTAIEYADSTSNPVRGCSGCELANPNWGDAPKSIIMQGDVNRCYAYHWVKTSNERGGNSGVPDNFFQAQFYPDALKALGWSSLRGTDRPNKPWLDGFPRIIFWNDLSDPFAPGAPPLDWLTASLDQFEVSPHINLFLTKNPAQMARFFDGTKVPTPIWPGTTITSQPTVQRGKDLFRLDADTYWLSIEPLLKPVDLAVLARLVGYQTLPEMGRAMHDRGKELWVAAGGESGRWARPTHPAWLTKIQQQATEAGFPFFLKQRGQWKQIKPDELDPEGGQWALVDLDGHGVLNPLSHKIGAIMKARAKAGMVLMQYQNDKGPVPVLGGQRWVEMPIIPAPVAVQSSFLD